jgi:hypothetical protein
MHYISQMGQVRYFRICINWSIHCLIPLTSHLQLIVCLVSCLDYVSCFFSHLLVAHRLFSYLFRVFSSMLSPSTSFRGN